MPRPPTARATLVARATIRVLLEYIFVLRVSPWVARSTADEAEPPLQGDIGPKTGLDPKEAL
jgi:hypothetical protein